MKHDLKCWAEPFQAIADGRKRFEIRQESDRAFREGDLLFLREWDIESRAYTGNAIEVTVTYLVRGPEWDIPAGMVVMSIATASELIKESYPPAQVDPTVTRDLLLLVNVDAPVEAITTWTEDERRAADEWASMMLLAASDESGNSFAPPSHLVQYQVKTWKA